MSQQSGSQVQLVSGNLALILTLQGLGRNEEARALLFELKEIAQHFGADVAVETSVAARA